MAATTLVQFQSQLPLYRKIQIRAANLQHHQVRLKASLCPQPGNISISAIPTSYYTCNFLLKPLRTLKQNPRVLTCPALSVNEPHETPVAPPAFPSFALAVVAVVSALIVRLIRILAERYVLSNPNPQGGLTSVICASTPLFFASFSTYGDDDRISTPLSVVASGMAKWLELYSTIVWVRVLLSWFPNIPWDDQPLSAIRDLCDPFLNVFRNMIPPVMGMLDVSPLLAFMVLGIFSTMLRAAASQ